MSVDATASQSALRFSTDDVRPRERLPYLGEVLGQSIARLDLAPIDGHPLRCVGQMHLFDGLAVISGKASAFSATRSRSLLSDGNDDLVLHVNRSGFSLASQVGRESRLNAGHALLLGTSDPGANVFPGPASWLTFRIPRSRLTGLVATPEDALVRPISASTEPLHLLLDYVDGALGQYRLASPPLRHLFATHVHDLVALVIGVTRDAAELARGRGLKVARLNAAKIDITRRLDDEGLSVVGVASRLGVTPRYVQKLFESEGTTFSQYLTHQRLARAYRTLLDPRFLDRAVTAIASDVGFGNLSHFNRMFRRAYGASPSDVRSHARATTQKDD